MWFASFWTIRKTTTPLPNNCGAKHWCLCCAPLHTSSRHIHTFFAVCPVLRATRLLYIRSLSSIFLLLELELGAAIVIWWKSDCEWCGWKRAPIFSLRQGGVRRGIVAMSFACVFGGRAVSHLRDFPFWWSLLG